VFARLAGAPASDGSAPAAGEGEDA
jgi:hypothetical protein